MSKPESQPQRRHIGWLLFGALAVAGVSSLATVLVLSNGQPSASAASYGRQSASIQPAIPSGVALTSWFDNGKGGQHVLQLTKGEAPPIGIRLTGTVLTDTDCDPDAQGLNHCRNDIDLGNGRIIAVIHNHAMHRFPCLEPGQKLSIAKLDAGWVVANEVQASRVN